ncbi:50S ribosomal protein L19 [Candidatus Auribacterota bacterium]
MNVIKKLDSAYLKKDVPKFKIGDVVKVYVKIIEGEKERLQVFNGTVIARKGSGLNATLTARRISFGEGVERVFMINSPRVEKIEVIKSGKVRRSKLYYLREKVGKGLKVKEKKKSVAVEGETAPAVNKVEEPAPEENKK